MIGRWQAIADNGRLLAIASLGATLLVPWLVMHFAPEAEYSQSICPHKLLTGLPCPGCGITRSLMSLYRGDVVQSVAYHAFGPAVLLACVVGIVVLIYELATRRDLLRPYLFHRGAAVALGLTLGLYHAARLAHFLATHDRAEILSESIWR